MKGFVICGKALESIRIFLKLEKYEFIVFSTLSI